MSTPPRDRARPGSPGQALPLALGLGALIAAAAVAIFLLGQVHLAKARAQTAADLGALSAGRRLQAALPAIGGQGPGRRGDWRAKLERLVAPLVQRSGARITDLRFPDRSHWPPSTVEVAVVVPGPGGTRVPAVARAALGMTSALPAAGASPSGEYRGPLVLRDGKPTCPPVAAAFDRMDAAAHADGIDLVVVSGFRSDAEQAVLFARHPDPKWVAPPGRSRHRFATELDLGAGHTLEPGASGGAWTWLARRAGDFGFLQRYSWEPWHYGYLPGCDGDGQGSSPGPPLDTADEAVTQLPQWVPARYRATVASAALQNGVPPALLAALLEQESGFDRWAVSGAGAEGIAQFMPATAAGIGLRDPFDPEQAIPAAARLLASYLRSFGSASLALAAYNAGEGAVRRYGGIPPYAETQGYVVRILALAGGTRAQVVPAGAQVVLVRAGDAYV